MKRLVSLLVLVAFVLSFGFVYAEKAVAPSEKAKNAKSVISVKNIIKKINANKKNIKDLDKTVNEQMKVVKKAIKELNSGKKKLNDKDIKIIKASISKISDIEKSLKENNDIINTKLEELKKAKKDKDPKAYLNLVTEVMSKQQERIKQLKNLIALLEMLQKDVFKL